MFLEYKNAPSLSFAFFSALLVSCFCLASSVQAEEIQVSETVLLCPEQTTYMVGETSGELTLKRWRVASSAEITCDTPNGLTEYVYFKNSNGDVASLSERNLQFLQAGETQLFAFYLENGKIVMRVRDIQVLEENATIEDDETKEETTENSQDYVSPMNTYIAYLVASGFISPEKVDIALQTINNLSTTSGTTAAVTTAGVVPQEPGTVCALNTRGTSYSCSTVEKLSNTTTNTTLGSESSTQQTLFSENYER